jgi:hypothetical protein
MLLFLRIATDTEINKGWKPEVDIDIDIDIDSDIDIDIDIDQDSVHLAEGFQKRRLKCEKLTDDGCQVMTKAHIAFGKVS